jgi:hypothetical protein
MYIKNTFLKILIPDLLCIQNFRSRQENAALMNSRPDVITILLALLRANLFERRQTYVTDSVAFLGRLYKIAVFSFPSLSLRESKIRSSKQC